jgi:hypothetical protein
METVRIYLLGIIISMSYCLLNYEVRASEPIKFYVSLNGNDSNKGSADRPFATLEAAQKAVREAKKIEVNRPIEVIVRAGVYYLTQTLELIPEDSGTKEAPITWRSADNEKVILSGGRTVSGDWKKDFDGKTWYVDLPSTKGWERDVAKAEVYLKQPIGPWHFRQLYINEKSAIRARFPNKN